MTLKEYLNTAPDDRLFYIGADSGFLIAGTKEELFEKFEELNWRLEAACIRIREKAQETYNLNLEQCGADARKTRMAKKKIDNLLPFKPIEEREVLSVYDRVTEEATNLKVTGNESGSIWSIREGEDSWGSINLEYNVEELAGAIIRGLVNGYNLTLTKELKKLMQCINMLEEYRQQSKRWEDFIGSYDVISISGLDPAYVIDETRKIVCQQLKEASNGVLEMS